MRATFRDHAMSDDGIIGWNCRAPAKNSNARSVIRQRHDAFIVGWMIATIIFSRSTRDRNHIQRFTAL
jgi:preprotein translocase subunit Sec63